MANLSQTMNINHNLLLILVTIIISVFFWVVLQFFRYKSIRLPITRINYFGQREFVRVHALYIVWIGFLLTSAYLSSILFIPRSGSRFYAGAKLDSLHRVMEDRHRLHGDRVVYKNGKPVVLMSELDKIVKNKLKLLRIIRNIPDTMILDSTTTAEARLTLSKSPQFVYKGITPKNRNKFIADSVEIKNTILDVTLIDPSGNLNFKIQPYATTSLKKVDSSTVRIWQWGVTPIKDDGLKDLTLYVSATVEGNTIIGDGDTVYRKSVFIKVKSIPKWSNYWRDNWGWICAVLAIVVPLIVPGIRKFITSLIAQRGLSHESSLFVPVAPELPQEVLSVEETFSTSLLKSNSVERRINLIIIQYAPRIVLINVNHANNRGIGFMISDTKIITCDHLTTDDLHHKYPISSHDNDFKALLRTKDKTKGLALLMPETNIAVGKQFFPVMGSSVQEGQSIYAVVVVPNGDNYTVTIIEGIIYSFISDNKETMIIRCEVNRSYLNIGAPILNLSGEIVGLVYSDKTASEDIMEVWCLSNSTINDFKTNLL